MKYDEFAEKYGMVKDEQVKDVCHFMEDGTDNTGAYEYDNLDGDNTHAKLQSLWGKAKRKEGELAILCKALDRFVTSSEEDGAGTEVPVVIAAMTHDEAVSLLRNDNPTFESLMRIFPQEDRDAWLEHYGEKRDGWIPHTAAPYSLTKCLEVIQKHLYSTKKFSCQLRLRSEEFFPSIKKDAIEDKKDAIEEVTRAWDRIRSYPARLFLVDIYSLCQDAIAGALSRSNMEIGNASWIYILPSSQQHLTAYEQLCDVLKTTLPTGFGNYKKLDCRYQVSLGDESALRGHLVSVLSHLSSQMDIMNPNAFERVNRKMQTDGRRYPAQVPGTGQKQP